MPVGVEYALGHPGAAGDGEQGVVHCSHRMPWWLALEGAPAPEPWGGNGKAGIACLGPERGWGPAREGLDRKSVV